MLQQVLDLLPETHTRWVFWYKIFLVTHFYNILEYHYFRMSFTGKLCILGSEEWNKIELAVEILRIIFSEC